MKQRHLYLISLLCIFSISVSCTPSLQIVGAQSNNTSANIYSSGSITYSSPPTPTPTPNPEILSPLHVDGTHLKDESGNIVILRGFILEGLSWHGINANSFAQMAAWGGNVVTIEFDCYMLEGNLAAYGTYLPSSYLSTIDNFVAWAQDNDLYVILRWVNDGTVNGHMRNEMSYYMDYFGYANWVSLWSTLASRYAGKGFLYNLAGEPLWWTASTAQRQMQAAVDIINAADSTAIIICPEYMEGDWGSTQMTIYLSYPIAGSNIIYAFDDYAYHFLSNTPSAIRSQALNLRGAQALLDAGKCVFAEEFGGEGNGLDYYKHPWSECATFSTLWLNNFMAVMDNGGYSGYVSWAWNVGTGSDLLADWNGTPNGYGSVVRNYYLDH